MNISFPIGLFVAFGIMVFGMIFGKEDIVAALMSFIDVPSLLITVGGTIATLFATFPLKVFVKTFQHFPIVLGFKKQDPVKYIRIMSDLSEEARRKGLLSLEDTVAEFDDEFLRESVMLLVDAVEPDKVRERLDNELNNIESRHAQAWDFYDKGAALAPGFGMIGTLIGLVLMLAEMDFEDEGGAGKLAANMAVALITTFYGSIMANVIYIPMATQLRVAHSEEMLCKEIIVEGIISIQAGENPRNVKEKLLSFLTAKEKESAKQDLEASGAQE